MAQNQHLNANAVLNITLEEHREGISSVNLTVQGVEAVWITVAPVELTIIPGTSSSEALSSGDQGMDPIDEESKEAKTKSHNGFVVDRKNLFESLLEKNGDQWEWSSNRSVNREPIKSWMSSKKQPKNCESSHLRYAMFSCRTRTTTSNSSIVSLVGKWHWKCFIAPYRTLRSSWTRQFQSYWNSAKVSSAELLDGASMPTQGLDGFAMDARTYRQELQTRSLNTSRDIEQRGAAFAPHSNPDFLGAYGDLSLFSALTPRKQSLMRDLPSSLQPLITQLERSRKLMVGLQLQPAESNRKLVRNLLRRLSIQPSNSRILSSLAILILDLPQNATPSYMHGLAHTLLMMPDIVYIEPDTQVYLIETQNLRRSYLNHWLSHWSWKSFINTASRILTLLHKFTGAKRSEEQLNMPGVVGAEPNAATMSCTDLDPIMLQSPWNAHSSVEEDSLDESGLAIFRSAIQNETETQQILQYPNDPLWPRQWYLKRVNTHKAWQTHTGDEPGAFRPVVAIVDTGLDYTHPDLRGNLWTNKAEIFGLPGVDDDGNGYIDDFYGINAITESGDPMDDNSHGTHCAGVIAAKGNNRLGIVGVNRGALLMSCKFLGSDGTGSISDAVKCFDYVLRMGASVLSNSWGGNGSRALREAVARTERLGLIFIAAAGNRGRDNDIFPVYPASYGTPNIISVAAVDHFGLAPFSNRGVRSVHLAAPGSDIISTVRHASYASLSGTSMAVPAVAGIAALLKSVSPSLRYTQIRDAIRMSVRSFANLPYQVRWGGVPDHALALEAVAGPSWYRPRAFSVSSSHSASLGASHDSKSPSHGSKWLHLLEPRKLSPGDSMKLWFTFYGLERRRFESRIMINLTTVTTRVKHAFTVPVTLHVDSPPRLNRAALPREISIPGLQNSESVVVKIPFENSGSGILKVDIALNTSSTLVHLSDSDTSSQLILEPSTSLSVTEGQVVSQYLHCILARSPSYHEILVTAHEGYYNEKSGVIKINVSCLPYTLRVSPPKLLIEPEDLDQPEIIRIAGGDRTQGREMKEVLQADSVNENVQHRTLRISLGSGQSLGFHKLSLLLQYIPLSTIERTGPSDVQGDYYRSKLRTSQKLVFLDITRLHPKKDCIQAKSTLSQYSTLISDTVWRVTELTALRNMPDGRQKYHFTNGFRMQYFGHVFDEILVSPHGFFSVEAATDTGRFPIPEVEDSPPGIIAPLWMDFLVVNQSSGVKTSGVFILEAPTLLIVQWNSLLPRWASTNEDERLQRGLYTFQTIVLSSGDIIFTYKQLARITSAHIGIKAPHHMMQRKAPPKKVSRNALLNGNLVYFLSSSAIAPEKLVFENTSAMYAIESFTTTPIHISVMYRRNATGLIQAFLLNEITNEVLTRIIPVQKSTR